MTLQGTVQECILANTSPGQWVNEHTVSSVPGVDRYALGKRLGNRATTLQLTRRDFVRLLSAQESAAAVGVQVWTPAELTGRGKGPRDHVGPEPAARLHRGHPSNAPHLGAGRRSVHPG